MRQPACSSPERPRTDTIRAKGFDPNQSRSNVTEPQPNLNRRMSDQEEHSQAGMTIGKTAENVKMRRHIWSWLHCRYRFVVQHGNGGRKQQKASTVME
jgi:hypothetical protein